MQKNKSILAGIFITGLVIIANYSDGQPPAAVATQATDVILPYRIHVSKGALSDFRQWVRATRWPHKETESGQSQGVQLTKSRIWYALSFNNLEWRNIW